MSRVYTPIRRTATKQHVGIIGCGKFAFAQIAWYLERTQGSVVRGVMDIEPALAESLAHRYGAAYATGDADEIFKDPEIDLVYVASNHATHAPYALSAIADGKAVHVEKPHAVTDEQINTLYEAMRDREASLQLGFNRPISPIGSEVIRALKSEADSSMLNWFIAGHEIAPDHWYFAPEEGGRVLGNLCHWIDFLLHVVDPEAWREIEIIPTRAAQSDCDIAVGYRFGDGTIAALTFSAKGHTFEGVRERFAGHSGDVLVRLDDFHTAVIERGASKRRLRTRFRDHGHAAAIERSYRMSAPGGGLGGADPDYVWTSGALALATRESLSTNSRVEFKGRPVKPRHGSGPRSGPVVLG